MVWVVEVHVFFFFLYERGIADVDKFILKTHATLSCGPCCLGLKLFSEKLIIGIAVDSTAEL